MDVVTKAAGHKITKHKSLFLNYTSFLYLCIIYLGEETPSCHGTLVEVRGQLSGVGSLLPIRRFWGSNSTHQIWCQTSLPILTAQILVLHLFNYLLFYIIWVKIKPRALHMLNKHL